MLMKVFFPSLTTVARFESTALASDSAQASQAPHLFGLYRVLCVQGVRPAQRTEPEAESKAKAVDSKRPCVKKEKHN